MEEITASQGRMRHMWKREALLEKKQNDLSFLLHKREKQRQGMCLSGLRQAR
jgi:hypothetical protein